MAKRSFGVLEQTLFDRRRRHSAVLLVGVSMIVVGLLLPARAASLTYSDGEVRSDPIVMTEDTVGSVGLDETATQSGVISGVHRFGKTGFGVLSLLGDNTFTGGVDLSMGTLVLGHQNGLGTGALDMASDTRLLFQSATPMAFANDVSLAGVSEWGGAEITHTGVISGAGRLLLAGRFDLRGSNTYTGGTEIAAGTSVTVGLDDSLGVGQVVMGNGASLTSNIRRKIVMNNAFQLNGNATFTALAPYELHGVISGNGRLIKNGTHALELYGNNTYTGGSIIEGSVWTWHNNALGTGAVTLRDGYLAMVGHSLANDFLLEGSNYITTGATAAAMSGDIGETAPGADVWINGAGSLTLTGQSSYSGQTRLSTRLIAAAESVLSNQSHYALDLGGTLALDHDQSIGGLSGSGRIEMAGKELDILQGPGVQVFSGQLIGDAGSLIRKYGDGRLVLNPAAASAYTGSFIAGGGILEIAGDYSGADALVSQGTLTGNGSIGAVSVSTGTLAGTSGQTLTMASLGMMQSSSILASFGAPSGQTLFHVLGDVRLDGFLDIENAGGFGPGVYRLMTYDGALDNRGLIIDRLPTGVSEDEIELQFTHDKQINVVSTTEATGPTLFWDGGDATLWNNGRIDGGSGIWRVGTRSFTTSDGSANNTMYPKPGFAIFQGQGGTVSVDNTTGDTQVTGMQFAADGYVLDGHDITMEVGDGIVRVGDGSSAGANFTAIINNVINGDGGLVKTDLGTLVLNANNQYIGGTEVRGGTLEVNGGIDDVLVGQNGRLQGSGWVENAEVHGTIAAGSAFPGEPSLAPAPGFGRLNIRGDLILSDTSIFELKVDAEGNHDLIDVRGTAYLDGRLVTLASGGDYADAMEYTFLNADGGIEGEFDGVNANLAFLQASLVYNENDVRLTLARNGLTFADIGNTANQRAAGSAVDALGVGSALYDRVLTLSADDARAGLDQLSGEVHASLKGALLTTGEAVSSTMSDRVAASFARLGATPTPTSEAGLNFWTSAAGGIGVLEANGNAARSTFAAGNLFVGADATFNQTWVFGAMLGYGSTSVNVADRSATANADNYHVGVYGGGEVEDFTFKFGGAYTHHDIETSRTVTMPGLSETLTSDRTGSTGQVFGEIGRKFAFDSGLLVEPFVNLAHASLLTGSFAEQGGAAAVSGSAAYASMTNLTLGIRGEADFALGDLQATARGMIGWQHALGSVDQASTHTFGNGAAFTVGGSPVARDSAVLEAGLDLNLNPNVDLGMTYNGRLGSGLQQHGIKANLSVKF